MSRGNTCVYLENLPYNGYVLAGGLAFYTDNNQYCNYCDYST